MFNTNFLLIFSCLKFHDLETCLWLTPNLGRAALCPPALEAGGCKCVRTCLREGIPGFSEISITAQGKRHPFLIGTSN